MKGLSSINGTGLSVFVGGPSPHQPPSIEGWLLFSEFSLELIKEGLTSDFSTVNN